MFLALLISPAFVLVGFPPSASAQTESVRYVATAPTTGSTTVGYRWWIKYGAAAWTVLTVAGSDSTLTPTITCAATVGVPHQVWVEAYDRPGVAVMSGEEMIGATTVRRYGPRSPYAIPYNPTSAAPGGCGRPVRQ